MAMTKREQSELSALRQEVRVARALRWTDEVERDLPAPKKAGEVHQGWDCDELAGVFRAWSSCAHHGIGVYTGPSKVTTGPVPRALYSTKALALRAWRCELERKAAEALAAVDAQIEELKGEA